MGTFFSGSLDPFLPHAILLSAAITASFAVAIGIVLENPKWSIANMLVIGGVALEVIFTLLLFGFDEGISNAQQSRIETQQSEIKLLEQKNEILSLQTAPRVIIGPKFMEALSRAKKSAKVEIRYLKDQPESWWVAQQISTLLDGTDWRPMAPYLMLKEISPEDRQPKPPGISDWPPMPPIMSGMLLLAKDMKQFEDPTSAASAMQQALGAAFSTLHMGADPRLSEDTLKILISPRVIIVFPKVETGVTPGK